MIRLLFILCCCVSPAIASGAPEVTEKEEKKVTEQSHTVFEAIFVEEVFTYFIDDKVVSSKEFRRSYHSRNLEEATVFKYKHDISLLITNPLKGKPIKHEIHNISFEDSYGSDCPHVLDYGDYKSKQTYYIADFKGAKSYRYRTLREKTEFSKLVNNNIILGKFGVRIGREVEIYGDLVKVDKDNPFEDRDGSFELILLDGKKKSVYINLALDSEYEASGGKLPEVGNGITLEGYESVIVAPFDVPKKDLKIRNELEYIHSWNLDTHFVVTKVIEK